MKCFCAWLNQLLIHWWVISPAYIFSHLISCPKHLGAAVGRCYHVCDLDSPPWRLPHCAALCCWKDCRRENKTLVCSTVNSTIYNLLWLKLQIQMQLKTIKEYCIYTVYIRKMLCFSIQTHPHVFIFYTLLGVASF